jgi:hypothetical protein
MRPSPRIPPALATLALALLAQPGLAQPLGTAITYQGLLRDGGTPATGLYDLQACLFDTPAGPAALVCAADADDVPVEEGVFTVALDFGAAFAGQQRFLELRVRPGASTGAYTVLLPRQQLRPAPEALRASVASAAPWSGLSGVPSGFADGIDNDSGGSVTTIGTGAGLTGGPITGSGTVAIANGGVSTAMIAPGAVGSSQIANAGVGPGQIATNAVDSAKIADGSVAAADIAVNAVGAAQLANNAVDTAALIDASVTGPKIAAGAVGSTQINNAQVQARIAGSCPPDTYISGINADGSVACMIPPVTIRRILPIEDAEVSGTDLALRADQRPVLAYREDAGKRLALFDCADQTCSSGSARTLDPTTTTGSRNRIVLRADGRPVIAYYDATAGDLKFYDCADAACTNGTARTLQTAGDVGSDVSIALRADGRPVLAYYAAGSGNLGFYDCANPACNSGLGRTLEFTDDVGRSTDIAVRPSGNPIISHYDDTNKRLKIFACSAPDCSAGTAAAAGGTVSHGLHNALALRSTGRPVLAYHQFPPGSVRVANCGNDDCSTWTSAVYGANNVGYGVALAIGPGDQPRVAFEEALALNFLACQNPNCTSSSPQVLDAIGQVGTYPAMAIRADGRPVIAHADRSYGKVLILICGNETCQ